MTIDEILAVAQFLGDDMTDEQADRLMDHVRSLSIQDRESIIDEVGGKLYAEVSMHAAELGGFHRY